MNKFRISTGVFVAALLLVASPLSAVAAQHGVGVDGQVEARTQAQIEARGSATTSDARDDERDSDASDDGADNEERGVPGDIRTTFGGDAEVSVSAREIRSMSDEQKVDFLTTVKTHAEVQSQQDLENFAKGVLAVDANVEEVESSEEEVRVKYRVPARFLGVFKASLLATVTVRSEAAGEVKTKLPWYSFLYGKADTVSSASLRNAITSDADVASSIESETSFDSQTQARVINAVHSLLKARASAAANASADEEASAQ